ncbi:hypothetical protein [Campylobacter concisus]|nr:hypothetical protein [Campylobacter concisus]
MRQCFAPHAFYHHASVRQILKIMSEHITLQNSVASFARPKFSSLLR